MRYRWLQRGKLFDLKILLSESNRQFSVDDAYLQRAMSSIPKRSIVLIEDIDCAFLPRDTPEDHHFSPSPVWISRSHSQSPSMNPNCRVTLSGLLNMLDGVGSEEGKLFFATVSLALTEYAS